MGSSENLVGRDAATAVLARLIDGAEDRGEALVVLGPAGIGKSALLDYAAGQAHALGVRSLRTTGVQAETHLPFAGLHQLLGPLLQYADQLPGPQRSALLVAFGMTESGSVNIFMVALAALGLLSAGGDQAPLLLIVEDAHWLDRPTAEVLAFIARRVESEPIVLLCAVRDGFDGPLSGAGLPELHLGALDDDAARALLDSRFPSLDVVVRDRLLEEAGGNPLALIELPAALDNAARTGAAVLPSSLPLTARLERAFAARVADLPDQTQTVITVAALNDGDSLGEILEAATRIADRLVTATALEPALDAELLVVEDDALRFRHPLVRSAIRQGLTLADRCAIHAALGAALVDDPYRRVWHRAAAVIGKDEAVARQLVAAADQAQQRGGITEAVAALERAAALTQGVGHRDQLLIRAAQLAHELGRSELVRRFLRQTESAQLEPSTAARRLLLSDRYDARGAGAPAQVQALIDAANAAAGEGEMDLALQVLDRAAYRCWWSDPGETIREELVLAAHSLGAADDDPRLLQILAWADPIGHGGVVVERLPSARSYERFDARDLDRIGTAAQAVGAFDRANVFLSATASRYREQGRLGLLVRVLVSQAWGAILLCDLAVAAQAAEEAQRLARETNQPVGRASAQVASAMIAAIRGDPGAALRLATEAEQVAMPAGAAGVLSGALSARGLSALAHGRHGDAYDHLIRLFDPSDPAFHPVQSSWAIGDFAEAASRSDRTGIGIELLAGMEELAARTPSARAHVALLHARPLLAATEDAETLYGLALAADLSRWPLVRARLQLSFGEWLRRQRRVSDARQQLRAARDGFDALGAVPWGERARAELRASGESSRRRTPDARDDLTPQELQIATMVAGGLSNREIAQQLYLSHRTVGSHLYRIYPKLGITSRSQLHTVLGDAAVPRPVGQSTED